MSYGKNTVNHSAIKVIQRTLDNTLTHYTLEVVKVVPGRGENDGDAATYELRKLTYQSATMREPVILVDQMVRDTDPGFDDVITTHEFRGSVRADFKYEVTWDSEKGEYTN